LSIHLRDPAKAYPDGLVTTGTLRRPTTLSVLLSLGALLTACSSHYAARVSPPTTTARTTPTRATTETTKSAPRKPAARRALCPLTDLPPAGGKVPARPALAVKVENLPAARPQYGLAQADIVYEEPVEGGITRFIAIYQCNNSGRIEPVRSGRWIDPDLLSQFGAHPLFAYAGAVQPVVAKIDSSSLIDVGVDRGPPTDYWRDPNRYEPHNLVSSTAVLYALGGKEGAQARPPSPVFTYGPLLPGTPAASAFIPYLYSPVTWTWHRNVGLYFRSYSDTGPATLGGGGQITAANVVIMHLVAYQSPFVEDVNGDHETLLTLTGSGPLEVIRDGAAIQGTWSRPNLSDVTRLLNSKGKVIPLSPGVTWIELVPTTIPYTVTP
jgi:Protein of unknown function (DUF3048) N-terminal domain/Protein of unknown function (DUF3048) C-terminal domain